MANAPFPGKQLLNGSIISINMPYSLILLILVYTVQGVPI